MGNRLFMNMNNQHSRLVFFMLIIIGCFNTSVIICSGMGMGKPSPVVLQDTSISAGLSKPSGTLMQLNDSLKLSLTINDLGRSRVLVEKIISAIANDKADELLRSESYYFVGIFYLKTSKYFEAIKYLNFSIKLKEALKENSERLARAYYNIGVAYNRLGDFKKHEDYSDQALNMEKKLFGDTSPQLIDTYLSLIIAYISLQDYDKAITFSNIALNITNSKPDSVPFYTLAELYSNFGVLYARLADYSKAKIFFDKAELIYRDHNITSGENYINLINNQAITYGALRLSEKSDQYYEKGIILARSSNSSSSYNLINSYAIILNSKGKTKRGEALLYEALTRAKKNVGPDSRIYIGVLNNYANYLRENNLDNVTSLKCYQTCIDYLKKNSHDISLKTAVYAGYALSLAKAGETEKALMVIQSLLFSADQEKQVPGEYDNPPAESVKPDKNSLNLLQTKYKILLELYEKSQDQGILIAAANTEELIIAVLEKVRVNISEDDSRLILGDRYRDIYLHAIRDFNLLYSQTNNRVYLEKAFEYSEKSKVAGLLASTRELKAVQFQIPEKTADYERLLQRDLSLLNARINEEMLKDNPDSMLINKWNNSLIETTRLRDSLIKVFEHKYPGYYTIKYDAKVASLKDIPDIFGRNGNYINYVLSDTLLYIFIVNRKHQELLTLRVDTAFYNNIRQFRSSLAMPSPSEDAAYEFKKFQTTGLRLYNALIEPVSPYLISNQIVISPDNLLSYIPFETIPVSMYKGDKILYRDINYLMDDFNIFYTYSATFSKDLTKTRFSLSNRLIAFAPDYTEPIDIQSVLLNRQAETGFLPDLPYARKEAEFVSTLTGGKLYENMNAKESVFKSEAGSYDIIHMAMHTLINDQDPMHSKLIFSSENDSADDGYLNTYEVYGIPLKAKMVVLSSCNTGTGMLYSGEGILSLARGFIYSGSKSVVMSMWEIEDRSGVDIVELFYLNLKKGYTKSVALRKARIAYLKNADQLRSHPYFWSSLIIYGDNAPLYYTNYFIIGGIIVALLIFIFVYFRKRKYS
jgi:CHAT domain-containing protein